MISRVKRSLALLLSFALSAPAPALAQRIGASVGAAAEVRLAPVPVVLGTSPTLSALPAALASGLSLAASAPIPVVTPPLPASAVPAAPVAGVAPAAQDAAPDPERSSPEAARTEASREFDGTSDRPAAPEAEAPASSAVGEGRAPLQSHEAAAAPRPSAVPAPAASARPARGARFVTAIAPALVGAGVVLMLVSAAHAAILPAVIGAALTLSGIYAPRAVAAGRAAVLAPAAPRAPPVSAPATQGPAASSRSGRYGDPVLDSLVERHLPAAAASGRKIGLEIEFYGPGREEVMLALREQLGGSFDLGYVDFDPAAPVRKTADYTYTRDGKNTAFKLRMEHDGARESFLVDAAGVKKTFRSRDEAHAFVRETFGAPVSAFKLRWAEDYTITMSGKAGGRRLDIPFEWSALGEKMTGAGVRRQFKSHALFEEQVERWRLGQDRFFHGATILKDSALGELFVTNETNYALELVTAPLDYAQMPLVRGMLDTLKGLGAHDGAHDVGIHVNITVDKNNVGEMRRLILAYDAVRKNARAFFRPHAKRDHWIGGEKEGLLAALADPAYQPSLAEFQTLMAKSSKGKMSDLNMGHAARSYGRPAAEFRLFNLDFDAVEDMVDFSLALTHSAAR